MTTANAIIADALRRKRAPRRGTPVELETLRSACSFGQTPTQPAIVDGRTAGEKKLAMALLDPAERKHIALMARETHGTALKAAAALGVSLDEYRETIRRNPIPLRPHCDVVMNSEVTA